MRNMEYGNIWNMGIYGIWEYMRDDPVGRLYDSIGIGLDWDWDWIGLC